MKLSERIFDGNPRGDPHKTLDATERDVIMAVSIPRVPTRALCSGDIAHDDSLDSGGQQPASMEAHHRVQTNSYELLIRRSFPPRSCLKHRVTPTRCPG